MQARIAAALDQAPPGPLRAISICAGQGRDLIGVLREHPRRGDVTARLVELDPRNAAAARQLAADAGLTQVEVVTGDAAQTDVYAGLVPASLVLACGVFGNITDEDVARTIRCCAGLCAPGGTVVWTRGRGEPDLVPQICDWFAAEGFELLGVSEPADVPEPRATGGSARTGLPERPGRCPTSRCSPSPATTCWRTAAALRGGARDRAAAMVRTCCGLAAAAVSARRTGPASAPA